MEQWIRIKIVIKPGYNLTKASTKAWVEAFEKELKGFNAVERVEFEDYKLANKGEQ